MVVSFFEPMKKIKKLIMNFLVKLSTAVSHLIGIPNHDSMSGKYYARFFVKHEDTRVILI